MKKLLICSFLRDSANEYRRIMQIFPHNFFKAYECKTEKEFAENLESADKIVIPCIYNNAKKEMFLREKYDLHDSRFISIGLDTEDEDIRKPLLHFSFGDKNEDK